MKKYILLFSFNLIALLAFSQEKLITGTLTDSQGYGIPGVNILIKGTKTGTTTDINGYYQIKAKIGDVLVFRAVGMKSKEIEVNQRNFPSQVSAGQAEKRQDSVAYNHQEFLNLLDSLASPSKNIGMLNQKSAKYKIKNSGDNPPIRIPKVYKIKKFGNKYFISTWLQNNRYSQEWRVNYKTALNVSAINRLPDLQNSFAQGSPQNGLTQWQGAETGEIFSWGPPLSSLEYQSGNYAYDQNGALTAQGSGNGNPAKSYDPLSFFRSPLEWHNTLQINKNWGSSSIFINLDQHTQNTIIPKANSQSINTQLDYTLDIGAFTLNTGLTYRFVQQDLPSIGANWQTILGSIYRTPPSFDNANGFSNEEAIHQPSTYLLADGSTRSHSPELVDNPFGLTSTMPDGLSNRHFIAQAEVKYQSYKVKISHQMGLEAQNQDRQFGLLPQSAGSVEGRFTKRNEKINQFFQRTSFKWDILEGYYYKGHGLMLSFDYLFQHEKRDLQRLDAFDFAQDANFNLSQAGDTEQLSFDKNRNAHELFSKITWRGFGNMVHISLGNQMYFSNTLKNQDKAYFLPNIHTKLNIHQLLNVLDLQQYVLNEILINAAYSQSIQEAALIYNQWHFNSLRLDAEEYDSYYESEEILLQNPLSPERHRKFDIGLNLSFRYPRFSLAVNYFHHRNLEMLLPVFAENQFALSNVADLQNQGWEAEITFHTANYYYYNQYEFGWQSKLIFSQYNPVVTSLKNGLSQVPLSGYTDIYTSLIEGQPLGTIVGSAYLRNEAGQVIIDDFGYPLVNPTPQILGNPNPDFILNWLNNLRLSDWKLSIGLEYRQGGQVWNGTQQALNYLGKSQLTAEQRANTGFIFEGVLSDGSPNQTPVDFADPTQGLQGNRWARYGWSGISEENIEQASWLRVSEIKIEYDFSKLWRHLVKKSQAKVSIYARNLLLYTSYSGIDPNTTLLNYTQGQGLDLFNTPNTANFGIQLSWQF